VSYCAIGVSYVSPGVSSASTIVPHASSLTFPHHTTPRFGHENSVFAMQITRSKAWNIDDWQVIVELMLTTRVIPHNFIHGILDTLPSLCLHYLFPNVLRGFDSTFFQSGRLAFFSLALRGMTARLQCMCQTTGTFVDIFGRLSYLLFSENELQPTLPAMSIWHLGVRSLNLCIQLR